LRQAAQKELERDPPQHTWLPEGCEDAPPVRKGGVVTGVCNEYFVKYEVWIMFFLGKYTI